MEPLRKNQTVRAVIEGYSSEGLGIARVNGQVVFVHRAIRGEDCDILIMKVLKHAAFGKVTKIHTPSVHRQEPDCPYFGKCGGCDFRHMDYAEELSAKRQRVQDALQRIGGSNVVVEEILGAAEVDRYRNKSQYPIAHSGAVGFYRARSHEVVPVEQCRIQMAQADAAAQAVRQYIRRFRVPCYDEKTGRGLLRHLYVRTNGAGESLICLLGNGERAPHESELVELLRQAVPSAVGIVWGVNRRKGNVILGDSYRTLWGEDTLRDTLWGLTFRLSVPSFYQVNRAQAEVLYRKAVDFAGLTGEETVLDLYCGAGTITLCMARHCKQAIGAEIVPEAIDDARQNAKANGVENVEFFCGDATETAAELASRGLRPDVICVDPPRKGLAPEVVEAAAAMQPRRIVYVSCDPATLGRDVKRFAQYGYTAVRAVAVDLFPRTANVETVVLLSRETNPLTVEVRMEVETGEVKEHPTYKRIQEYVQEKYGFKVHTAYIAEVKRMVGLDMHKAPNAVEQRKHEYHPCPPEKVEAIKDALRHFGLIAE